jgi:hypothetical protein
VREPIQVVLSLASVAVVGVLAILVFRVSEPAHPEKAPAGGPTPAPAEALDVWLSNPEAPVQWIVKPYQDSPARAEIHDRSLSRRLGVPDATYRFFLLLVVNSGEEGFEFRCGTGILRVTDAGGREVESRPADTVLAEAGAEITGGDRFVVEALGIRAGTIRVPPGRMARLLLPFREDPDFPSWIRAAYVNDGLEVPLTRARFSRERLEGFLLRPDGPLVPGESGDLARRIDSASNRASDRPGN